MSGQKVENHSHEVSSACEEEGEVKGMQEDLMSLCHRLMKNCNLCEDKEILSRAQDGVRGVLGMFSTQKRKYSALEGDELGANSVVKAQRRFFAAKKRTRKRPEIAIPKDDEREKLIKDLLFPQKVFPDAEHKKSHFSELMERVSHLLKMNGFEVHENDIMSDVRYLEWAEACKVRIRKGEEGGRVHETVKVFQEKLERKENELGKAFQSHNYEKAKELCLILKC